MRRHRRGNNHKEDHRHDLKRRSITPEVKDRRDKNQARTERIRLGGGVHPGEHIRQTDKPERTHGKEKHPSKKQYRCNDLPN